MKENKTILVAGATGLAGSGLINSLLQHNYTVFALTRVSRPTGHENLHWVKFDAMTGEIESVLKDIPEIGGVIHAAAHVRQENKITDMEKTRKINIEFSDRLFKHCALQNTPIPVLYISSLGFLQHPLNSIITESDAVAPNTFYFLSKYWGELSLLEYSKTSKFRPIILRISSPVSTDFKLMHNTVVKKWIELGKSGKAITVDGTGKRRQDFVSTTDIAEAALLAIQNDNVSGIFNIASGTSVSMRELATIIATFFNVEIKYDDTKKDSANNWNISLKKAAEIIGYKPALSSTDTINNLLKYSFENSNNK